MTTDRLLELAQRAGVATHVDRESGAPVSSALACDDCYAPRPRLDIAVDLQAALEGDIGLHWVGGPKWRAWWDFGYEDNGEITDTFERCVVALAERAMK